MPDRAEAGFRSKRQADGLSLRFHSTARLPVGERIEIPYNAALRETEVFLWLEKYRAAWFPLPLPAAW